MITRLRLIKLSVRLKFLTGHTIIEALLVVALMGLVLEAALGLYLVGIRDWEIKDDRTDLMSNAHQVMNWLKKDLTDASRIIKAEPKEIEFLKPGGIASATDQGLWRYEPDNNTWANITGNLPTGITPQCLLHSYNGTLYVGASDGRVYKSTDSGRTWTATGTLPGADSIRCLLESYYEPGIIRLYAGTGPNGEVFTSTNQGDAWSPTGLSGLTTPPASVFSLGEDSQGKIYAGASYTINSHTCSYSNLFKASARTGDWIDASPIKGGWWNTNYTYRKTLTIYNNSTTKELLKGATIKFYFNHYALVQAGKSLANGNDVRLIYWDETTYTYTELDRINESAWNDRDTLAEIWFRLPQNIPANSSSSNYYVYYGNMAPGDPPANRDNIFLLWDGFTGPLDPTKWDTLGSPNVTWGELRIPAGSAVATKQTYPESIFEVRLHWNPDNSLGWCGWIDNISADTPPYTLWTTLSSNNFYPVKAKTDAETYTGQSIPLSGRWGKWGIGYVPTTNDTVWYYEVLGADRDTSISYAPNQPLVIRNINSPNVMRIDWVRIRTYFWPEPMTALGDELRGGPRAIISLIVDGSDTLYAGTDTSGDIYKSTNYGVSWVNTGILIDAGVNATDVYALGSGRSNIIYAGTRPNGNVFRTEDVGRTWQNTANLSGADEVPCLILVSDGKLYAGTRPNGDVFGTATEGASWVNLANIPGATTVYSLSPISTRIKYSWTGLRYRDTRSADDQLSRTVDGVTYQLEEGLVLRFQINYYKADQTPADTTTQEGRNQIRIVTINLTLERKGREFTLTNSVRLSKK